MLIIPGLVPRRKAKKSPETSRLPRPAFLTIMEGRMSLPFDATFKALLDYPRDWLDRLV